MGALVEAFDNPLDWYETRTRLYELERSDADLWQEIEALKRHNRILLECVAMLMRQNNLMKERDDH